MPSNIRKIHAVLWMASLVFIVVMIAPRPDEGTAEARMSPSVARVRCFAGTATVVNVVSRGLVYTGAEGTAFTSTTGITYHAPPGLPCVAVEIP